MDYSKITKILITGAAGFIGSNLAIEMVNRGWSVMGIDDLSFGDKENLNSIIDQPNFQFIQEDVRNKNLLFKLTSECDLIVHLAAYKIPRYGGAFDTLNINSECTRVVLEAAKTFKCRIFIASTSDVYGKNPEIPFSENSSLVIGSPKVARWSYAVSKLFDEQLFYAYHEKYEISGGIFRFFSSYGPNQNLTWRGGPQSVFITSSINKKALEIHGDGTQTRSFCYISDIINGIIKTILTPEADGEILNIGNDQEISILSLAKLIWSLINKNEPPLINFIPYANFPRQYEDVKKRIPDLSLAKKLLNFHPVITLEEGLIKTIKWQKAKIKHKT